MRTPKEKIEKYERLLHQIQLYYAVSLDSQKVKKLLDRISSWSYAHRSGNGLSDKEQQKRIDRAFDNLLNVED